MVKTRYPSDVLREVFHREKVLPLEAVKEILGTSSRMTVYRKLRTLGYRSSYSHSGRYYTLADIARYDQHGLWGFSGIWFSRYGSLVNTLRAVVHHSEAGCLASELETLLHVGVRNALKDLHGSGQLMREQIGSRYVYLSCALGEAQLARRKELVRRAVSAAPQAAMSGFGAAGMAEHLQTFLSLLNERQKRLYLGLESLKLGYGGDVETAAVAGVNVKTVARGRRELESKQVDPQRIRRAGAGRRPLKKTKS